MNILAIKAKNPVILIICYFWMYAVFVSAANAEGYLRISKDNNGYPQSLDTAVVRFAGQFKGSAVQVDLIGALHVAEQSYYRDLNSLFKQYDAILYELVAPKGTVITKAVDEKDDSSISTIQKQLRDVLGLTFQLEEINYSAPNLVHADFTPEELIDSIRAERAGLMATLTRALTVGISQGNTEEAKADNLSLIMQLLQPPSEKRTIKIRRIFARQFNSADELIEAINGPAGSAIIEGRNQKALSVLKTELQAGKKRIGIFYGAGHLQGMEAGLVRNFRTRKVGVRWLEAWNLRLPQ